MNKTNMIIIAVIAVYLIVIFPKMETSKNVETGKKEENKSDSENADKNNVSQSTTGQQKFRGYTH